jgi:hypothetical protein
MGMGREGENLPFAFTSPLDKRTVPSEGFRSAQSLYL